MDRVAFLGKVEEYQKGGWRLSLINASSVLSSDELPQGAVDVTWAFAKDDAFETIRERFVPSSDDVLPSISHLYWAAFLYENEIRELFGIKVDGLVVDLQGQLFQTAERVPFAPSAIRARLEKSGTLPAPAAAHGAKPAPAAPAAPAAAAAAPKPEAAQ